MSIELGQEEQIGTKVESVYEPKILFVDDEESVLRALKRFCRGRPWEVWLARSGTEALDILEEEGGVDVIVSDMRMPQMSGSKLLVQVKERFPDAIRILLTGYSDVTALEEAINEAKIYNYLTKPWDERLLLEVLEGALRFQETARERARLEELSQRQKRQLGMLALSLDKQVKERTMEIDQALTLMNITHDRMQRSFRDSMMVLSNIIEWKEGQDAGHTRFVADYAYRLAKHIGIENEELENIHIAALLHRIGILGLPDEVRNKAYHLLDTAEKKLYKQFPVWGEMALAGATHLSGVIPIIRHQCEHINGTGTPDALAGDDIPIGAKIIGLVSDFYSALSGLIDKNIKGMQAALDYIEQWQGKYYDTELVKQFVLLLDDFKPHKQESVALRLAELKPGMILNENVVTKQGMLLLSKGAALSASTITKLRAYEKSNDEKLNYVVCVYDEDGAADNDNHHG